MALCCNLSVKSFHAFMTSMVMSGIYPDIGTYSVCVYVCVYVHAHVAAHVDVCIYIFFQVLVCVFVYGYGFQLEDWSVLLKTGMKKKKF